MATPESLVKALAEGLIGALLAQPDTEKKTKPKVVKVDDVKAAVKAYLDETIAAEQEPQQTDLFTPPGIDIAESLYERQLAAARARAAAQDSDDMPPGFYDPNSPERAPWASPTVNS